MRLREIIFITIIFSSYVLTHSGCTNSKIKLNEDYYNNRFCNLVSGTTEVRHNYQHPSGSSHVRVDCETEDKVYEGGLDKRSSLDSIQQALFFSFLTGKKPVVVIYDTDGHIGRFEYRIMKGCELAGVECISFNLK